LSRLAKHVYLSISHDLYHENVGGVQQCLVIEEKRCNDIGSDYLHLAPYIPSLKLENLEAIDSYFYRLSFNGNYLGVVSASNCSTLFKFIKKNQENVEFKALVHAMHGHIPEHLGELFRNLDIEKIAFWIHDYFSVCEGFNLLRNSVSLCGAPNEESMSCSVCCYGQNRKRHINRIDGFLEPYTVDVIAPSKAAIDTWSVAVGERSIARFRKHIIEHIKLEKGPVTSRKRSQDQVKIAFVGHQMYSKGWDDFLDLVESTAGKSNVLFFHFGVNNSSHKLIDFIECISDKTNFLNTTQKLVQMDIDYVYIPSKWPETFNLVCYEALGAGCKVLTHPQAGNVTNLILSNPEKGLIFKTRKELSEFILNKRLLKIEQKAQPKIHHSSMSLEIFQ
jgi:hypothetical protein